MSCFTGARFLVFGLLAAASSGASAGQLGATSAGSVTISVTIAPHVTVMPPPAPARSGSSAADACLVTNGVGDFHVALLQPDGSGPAEPLAPVGRGAAGAGCLTGATAVALQVGSPGGSSVAADAPREPATLLIVPE